MEGIFTAKEATPNWKEQRWGRRAHGIFPSPQPTFLNNKKWQNKLFAFFLPFRYVSHAYIPVSKTTLFWIGGGWGEYSIHVHTSAQPGSCWENLLGSNSAFRNSIPIEWPDNLSGERGESIGSPEPKRAEVGTWWSIICGIWCTDSCYSFSKRL